MSLEAAREALHDATPPGWHVGRPGGTAIGSSGSAIAYPYFGGAPGIAPDHTIVVTGVGQADLKADGSGRAAAEKDALEVALADTRAQADAIAAVTKLSISGVLSVSASVSPNYGVMPMAGPAGEPSTGGSTPPRIVPEPPASQILSVSVTVAYQVR